MTQQYILAPYVATPYEIVERMLDLANVGPEDRVMDLGCGDGRVVIASALARGARGVGIDIEPYWVEQARAAATAAGVDSRVHFEHADAMHFDLSGASVVFLYLVHWSTQRIADRLHRECAPGTRVVSHSFGFDAVATATSEIVADAEGCSRRLHLWVVGS